MIAWTVAIIFAVTTLFLYGMWQRGIRNSVYLTDLIVAILLDDETYGKQKALLTEFVKGSKYPTPAILAGKVSNGLCLIAEKLAPIIHDKNRFLMMMLNQRATIAKNSSAAD